LQKAAALLQFVLLRGVQLDDDHREHIRHGLDWVGYEFQRLINELAEIPSHEYGVLGSSEIVCGAVATTVYKSQQFSVVTIQLDGGRRIAAMGPLPPLASGSRVAIRGTWKTRGSALPISRHDPLVRGNGEYLCVDAVLSFASATIAGTLRVTGAMDFLILEKEESKELD